MTPDLPSHPDESTIVAILAYDGITALDLVGPYESLNRVPGVSVVVCGLAVGTVRTESGSLGLIVDHPIGEVIRPDVLVIPGGGVAGISALIENPDLMSWVRTTSETSEWTASVCTGSIVLGAAGLLRDRQATTHWRARDFLRRFGAEYLDERLVESGKFLTSAGVSAGIELGLSLAEKIAGTEIASAIELSIQYSPRPPFGTGSPEIAGPALVKVATEKLSAG